MNTDSYSHFLEDYGYAYPDELVAKVGAEPRESARLLVHNRATRETSIATFRELATFLPEGSFLVFNNTRVFPARFSLITPRGRVREVIAVAIRDYEVEVMVAKPLRVGRAYALPSGVLLQVIGRQGKVTTLCTPFVAHEMYAYLEAHGKTPLPPYIEQGSVDESYLRTRYQTTFAEREGSSAAPTASLHFSPELMKVLKSAGIHVAYLTLHVGPGTFLPVIDETLERGVLHEEWYEVSEETMRAVMCAQREGRRVIPVGTTALRALESAARRSGVVEAGEGTTDLFIRPGYTFRVADGLITNFHVPHSSLLMLVDALLGGNGAWRPLYEQAIEERFRLFSFGDGMLIL